ncbi:MAG: GntR family transcriptional regulator [bacterium]|nr:GntR family transcriptional regulator [bacterium]
MNLSIDFESKIPLYYQLKEQIKQHILDGEYKEGDLIPSEREFSDNYELSSTTIRRALNDLVQENFLERKAGKGTFVRHKKVKRDLHKVLGFTKNMTEMGLAPTTKVLSKKVVAANAFARKRLGLKKGDKVVRLERLRLADDVPMMLETRYIRTDLCPNIEKEELSSSLWRVFEDKYGLKPNCHSQGMKIATVSGHAAANLTLNDNSLVFLIKGVTYVQDHEPIECEESLYRSDKYELTFEAIVD